MKLAVATDDFTTVTGHIGRCNGFIIYNIEQGSIVSREQLDNNFTHHRMQKHHHGEEHGHGHSHGGLITALESCSHLICSAAGWRVVDDLKNNNIDVIFTDEMEADSAALKFAEGTLEIKDSGVCKNH